MLSNNIFYGHDFTGLLASANAQVEGATIFAYHVDDPERYGVVEFDAKGRAGQSASKKSPNIPRATSR